MNSFRLFDLIWFVICYKVQNLESKLPMAINITSFDYVKFDNSTTRQLYFTAFGKTFKFKLKHESSRLFLTAKVFLYADDNIKKFYLQNFFSDGQIIFKGHLEGRNDTKVIGYYSQRLFIGRVILNNTVYYLEPANRYFPQTDSKLGIMYDLSRVNEHMDSQPSCERFTKENVKHFNNFHLPEHNYNNLQRKASHSSSKICSLDVLVDHTYYRYMESNIKAVLLEILHLISIANSIFKESDVDGTGKSEVIEFLVDRITIFENKIQIAYPYSDESSYSPVFVEKLKEYQNPYCLLIYFTHKNLKRKDLCSNRKLGRICSNSDSKSKIHNVIFITNFIKGMEIPRHRMALTFLHYLGHAFGSQNDPANDSVCSPARFRKDDGNYIMEPHYTSRSKLGINNWKFSNCSLRSMNKFIKNKDSCLKKVFNSSCENGIVEEGESCDCNPSERKCGKTGLCCYNKQHAMHCTLRLGAYCTFGTDECCNYDCLITSMKENRTCFSNKPCWNVTSFCHGSSPFCPAKIQSDNTSCLNNKGICIKGKCDTEICKIKSLRSCQCFSRHTECYVCCKNKSSDCLPATSFDIFTSTMEAYVKNEGTPCDNDYGLCISNGTCIRKSIYKEHTVAEYVYVLPFVGIIVIAIGCFVSQREKRPSIVDIGRKPRGRNTRET
ncbi:disintegrin and metalloproteinase domain-containing protein 10-like [Centruroides sculpturatus]|uniref:disintegrin and metalloproteinase domain-containing protein 10-like n=1 Tax=Centruroides sculpturatus TaxID=218467 RepID=UPI000C6E6BF3|nr:disintegrin and metalloproteinase domain-containing protein 10-like [Centruroides sculpturatus]